MTNNKSGVFVRNNIIYVQASIDGVFYRKSTKKEATKTNLLWAKKNAESVLLNIIGISDKPKSYTLEEFGYLSLEINSSNRKENTNKDYMMTFKRHILPHFGKWRLEDIRPTDLKKWQNNLARVISGKRIMNIRTIFRGILQDAFIDELININPFDRVRPPKQEKTIIYPWNLEEVQFIIKHAQGWFRNYLILAFFTGMRVGEIIALKWSDINFIDETIEVKRSTRKRIISSPKTLSSIRTIDMLPIVKNTLIEQKKHSMLRSEFIFINQYGKHFLDPANLTKRHWQPLLEELNMQYRILYQTRHTFASLMLQQGEEIGWVSQMMGHTDIHTTLTKYARFIPRETKKRAVFLNNLDFDGMQICTKSAH